MQKLSIGKLCEKYSTPVPRYTSYPTAIELKPVDDPAKVTSMLARAGTTPLSLYVHLPFCPSLCYFCACNKIIDTTPGVKLDYLQKLELELKLITAAAGRRLTIVDMHLGGGSPSYLTVEELESLEQLLQSNFDLVSGCERSIEIDPRTFTADKAELIFAQGYRRVSLGIQDFDPLVQEAVNRVQLVEMTEDTVNYLRRAGFESLNFDLIYGLPEQNLSGFGATLRHVIRLRPQRIALYGYAHVNWKVKVQNVFRKLDVPPPETRIQLFELALQELGRAGYECIGLDHFALPDDELVRAYRDGTLRRNFMGYTIVKGQGVLGIGVSAISDLGGSMFQNYVKLEEYYAALGAGRLPVGKMLCRSAEDKVRAALIERLMCHNHVALDWLSANTEDPSLAASVFKGGLEALSPLTADGLVVLNPGSIEVTETGKLFVRSIAAVFDAYLPLHRQSESQVFSRGV